MIDYIVTHWQGLLLAFGLFVALPIVGMLLPWALIEGHDRRLELRHLRRENHRLARENLRLQREARGLPV